LLSRSKAIALLLVTAAIIAAVALYLPPTPQPLSYHHFADQRAWLGIPNFGDVASNLPFAIVGIWGLIFILRIPRQALSEHFVDSRERWPYILVFVGLLLTAFGSSYYHLAPDNARLVWDRLPMTIVFMSMVAAVIMERISVRAGLWLLPLLLSIGAGSVVQWHLSEMRGHGDLRFYAAVQIYSAVVLLLALFMPAKYTRNSDFAVIAVFYLLAKILETANRQIFEVGHIVSGHTLKHLAAAGAGYWILRMLQRRRPLLDL
jgi:hypothetical protein